MFNTAKNMGKKFDNDNIDVEDNNNQKETKTDQ